MSSSDRVNHQVIADNCIQMAAVNCCKVFASKKSKTYYAAGIGINRKHFLSSVEARGIFFQETCDKMKSFRDKYAEGKYTWEVIREMFQAAMAVVEEYEKARGQSVDLSEAVGGKRVDLVEPQGTES